MNHISLSDCISLIFPLFSTLLNSFCNRREKRDATDGHSDPCDEAPNGLDGGHDGHDGAGGYPNGTANGMNGKEQRAFGHRRGGTFWWTFVMSMRPSPPIPIKKQLPVDGKRGDL